MQTVRVRTSQNIDIDYEVASLGDRILGHIIDLFLLFGILYVILIPLILINPRFFEHGLSKTMIALIILISIITIFYDLAAEVFFNGQSIGKRAMKIRVVSINGSRPTLGQFLMRWVFRLIDFLLGWGIVALIAVAVSDKKQRIGDMVAGTTVIKTQPKAQLKDLFFAPVEDDYEPVFTEAGSLRDEDVTLIQEVISNFRSTRNSQLVYEMTVSVKNHLNVTIPPHMNDFEFLQAVIKDYIFISSRAAV